MQMFNGIHYHIYKKKAMKKLSISYVLMTIHHSMWTWNSKRCFIHQLVFYL